jgi:putative ABC transport system permease protein
VIDSWALAGLANTHNLFLADLRIASRNILRQRRRSMIALAAIGFGVVAMMLSAGYIEWIFWANREGVAVNQLGHIQVAKQGFHEEGLADPAAFLLPGNPAVLNTIEHQPDVRSVSPRIIFNGLASHGDSTLSFVGEGIDPARDPSTNNLLIVAGNRLDASDPKGVLLGTGLAANLGVGVGDSIVLLTDIPGGGINAVEGHVRGLASTLMKSYDDSMLRIPISLARTLLHTQGEHLWVVRLQKTEMTARATKALSANPALRGFEVIPWTQLADFYNKTVALFSRQMAVVKFIIAVIIVLSISNTMSMSVMERTVEIGTAMALGVRRKRIMQLFLLEGALLGFIGGLCGTMLGYLLATLISFIGIAMPPAPGMSRGFVASILVTPPIIYEALLIALVTALIASIYPAWRASRLVIVDALRHNR